MSKRDVSGEDALKVLEDESVFILDVRTPWEFQGGALARAVLIPVDELDNRAEDELPEDKSAPILVYCAHGIRSLTAMKILEKHGYTNVTNLHGGLAHYQFFLSLSGRLK